MDTDIKRSVSEAMWQQLANRLLARPIGRPAAPPSTDLPAEITT